MTFKVASQMCRGCAWGPTPDHGTPEQLAAERLRVDAELVRYPGADVVFRCHRATFVDSIRGALGDGRRYPAVLCRGACAHYGRRDLDPSPVGPIDRDFDALLRLGLAKGPCDRAVTKSDEAGSSPAPSLPKRVLPAHFVPGTGRSEKMNKVYMLLGSWEYQNDLILGVSLSLEGVQKMRDDFLSLPIEKKLKLGVSSDSLDDVNIVERELEKLGR